MTPDPTELELRLATEADRFELRRMYAEHTRVLHGFDSTVAPGQELEDDWWRKPDDLFPLLALADGTPAGFVLVIGERYIEALGETGDYSVWEMFLEPRYRGTGLAERVMRATFARYPGSWYLLAMPNNQRAVRFWRRILATQPGGVVEAAKGGMIAFRFRA